MSRIRKTIINENLINNIRIILNLAKQKDIIWMIKANAYGHGCKEVTNVLTQQGQNKFGVYDLDELKVLNSSFKNIQIFVLDGLTHNEWIELSQIKLVNQVIICINKISDLDKASKIVNSKISYHLFVETGFNWYGESNVELFCKTAFEKNINIEGICSHFVSSDQLFSDISINQLNRFENFIRTSQNYFPNIKTHLGNSNALINNLTPNYTYYRIGRLLYGGIDHLGLKQIMKIECEVLCTKRISKGSSVGYGSTYTCTKDTNIAVIACGYKDGIDQRLSNIGNFKVQNSICPIIGKVAMNLIVLDIGDIHINEGEYITITDNIQNIKIVDHAEKIDSLDYEFMTKLNLV